MYINELKYYYYTVTPIYIPCEPGGLSAQQLIVQGMKFS